MDPKANHFYHRTHLSRGFIGESGAQFHASANSFMLDRGLLTRSRCELWSSSENSSPEWHHSCNQRDKHIHYPFVRCNTSHSNEISQDSSRNRRGGWACSTQGWEILTKLRIGKREQWYQLLHIRWKTSGQGWSSADVVTLHWRRPHATRPSWRLWTPSALRRCRRCLPPACPESDAIRFSFVRSQKPIRLRQIRVCITENYLIEWYLITTLWIRPLLVLVSVFANYAP